MIISFMGWIGVLISIFMLLCLFLCMIVVEVNMIIVIVRMILIRLGMILIIVCCLGLKNRVILNVGVVWFGGCWKSFVNGIVCRFMMVLVIMVLDLLMIYWVIGWLVFLFVDVGEFSLILGECVMCWVRLFGRMNVVCICVDVMVFLVFVIVV